MTKRRMFLRMVTASLLRRRSRMLIALLSIGIGATILAGMVTIYYDVPRQMRAQMRSYGANMLLMPAEGETLDSEKLAAALHKLPDDALVGASPYRYVRLDMTSRQQSFTTAGTDFAQVRKTSPYFSVEGSYPEAPREVLVGKEIAETIGVKVGSDMELTWQPAARDADGTAEDDRVPGATLAGSAKGFGDQMVYVTATLDGEAKIAEISIDASTQTPEYGGRAQTEPAFAAQFIGKALPLTLGDDVDALSGATVTSAAVVEALNAARAADAAAGAGPSGQPKTTRYRVTGILVTGGEEEGYVFMSTDDLRTLTGEDRLDVAELSISADEAQLNAYAEALTGDGVMARLVKRVTKSETAVLGKLQALVFLVTVVVLILTMICVSTTMMAVVSERRREIGLRKALGASDNSIRGEFLGEGMFLGLLGGALGAVLGFVFAQVVSVNVFHASIMFRPLLLPVTVLVSMVIAAASCLMPIKRAVAIDPAIVLKGE
ncbi:MAG: FtsX-like permease family protein [Clostridia bacterium]|nr:FtsX-like permease family protein [Clostridia bacterium]